MNIGYKKKNSTNIHYSEAPKCDMECMTNPYVGTNIGSQQAKEFRHHYTSRYHIPIFLSYTYKIVPNPLMFGRVIPSIACSQPCCTDVSARRVALLHRSINFITIAFFFILSLFKCGPIALEEMPSFHASLLCVLPPSEILWIRRYQSVCY